MRIKRTIGVWAILVVCGVVVAGAMAWLTRDVLTAEKNRAAAETRADLEERTRLALWRMDAAAAAIAALENRRPLLHFVATADESNGKLVKLRFELHENDGSLPEKLRVMLGWESSSKDAWQLFSRAAQAGELGWEAVPLAAEQQQSQMAALRQTKAQVELRQEPEFQQYSNYNEMSQRAKAVGETLKNSLDSDPTSGADGKGDEKIIALGTMRAAWIHRELFLLRPAALSAGGLTENRLQGALMNRTALRQRLLAEVADLLPQADLVAVDDGAAATQDPLALVTFPFRLLRNEIPPAVPAALNRPLVIGWLAVLMAGITATLLVHGVMRLSERRASFVSAVTHELRTPLTTFRLYSEMLEKGAVKEEKRGEYLRVLSREADRLTHLVENVLAFSGIERGSARSTARNWQVADLLEPMRERFEARLATTGLVLRMDLDEPAALKSCRADAAAVEHILFNLIDNAAKYAARSDPPEVAVGVRFGPAGVEISVRDHGPGIPPSERRRVFRAFHKSATEAADTCPGVGLGLSLSRRLARAQGGALEFGKAEKGTCFILRLPRCR